MTTSVQAPAQARKPVARKIRKTAPGQITIRAGKAEDAYSVTEIPVGGAFEGRAFRCEKFGSAETYDVFLARNGQDNTCTCPGGTWRGTCKHMDGLRVLLERGKLDDTPAFGS